MPKSKNNRLSKRGNHRQRVKTHDEYLVKTYPKSYDFNTYTSPEEILTEDIGTPVEVGKGKYKVEYSDIEEKAVLRNQLASLIKETTSKKDIKAVEDLLDVSLTDNQQ